MSTVLPHSKASYLLSNSKLKICLACFGTKKYALHEDLNNQAI